MIDAEVLGTAVPALRALPRAVLQRLASAVIERTVRPRATIFRSGDRPAALHFIIAGRVRVVQEGDGRARVVHWEDPGGTLGEVPTFADIAYPATAVAHTAVRVALLPGDAARRLAAEQPALATLFLSRLAHRAAGVLEQLARVRGETVTSRLARFLLERSRDATNGAFDLGMSQAALAEELGTVREVLVRSLRSLKRAGALSQSGRGTYRVDRPWLLRALVD